MCRVKTGADVCNMQDLENLVIGIIFRQIDEFRRDELVSAVKYYLNGSSIGRNSLYVENVIDSTLKQCVSNDWLMRQGNSYSPSKLSYN